MDMIKKLPLVEKSAIAALALSVGSLAVAFADDADPYAGYIYLTKDDTAAKNSWNNTDAETFKQGNWSESFSTERNYYVPAGRTFYADGDSGTAGTWAGGELVIAGTMVSYVRIDSNRAPKVPNLVFLGGSVLRGSAYGILNSPTRMTVLAAADDPLVIQMQYHVSHKSYRSRLFADIYGDPGAAIRIEAMSSAATNGFTYHTGTFANFCGTLTLTGEKVNAFRAEGNSHYFTMPGKVIVTNSAVFMPSYDDPTTPHKNVLVGALEVTDGGIADFPTYKSADSVVTLGLTNSLKIADGGVVRVSNITTPSGFVPPANSGAADDYRLAFRIANLTGDAAIAPDIDNANVTVVNKSYDEAFGWKLFTRDGEGGSKDVYVGVTNMAVCVKTLTNGASPTDATCWGGGVLPKEGNDFYFAYRFNPFPNWDFTQSKLIFDNGYGHYWNATATMDLNAKAYYVLNPCSITLWKNCSRRWRGGPLTLAAGASMSFSLQNPCPQLRIESEVRGNGSLLFKPYSDNLSKYLMTLENLNTNWHGRLTVYGYTSSTYPYNTILGDARNWGGEFRADTNTYSAVTLGSNTCVYVTNNVCFNDPTRGFRLKDAPQLMVKEGFTLTLSNQVTYAGMVTKSGEGVLELGGTARFIDGQAETAPVEWTNVLAVAAGALKVSSKEACDGLAISFAEGTKLVIPAGSAYGLYNVKWDAPLTTAAADGKIAVEIDTAGAALPEDGFTTTIATLSETAGVSTDLFKVARIPGYKMKDVKTRPTEDGVAYDVRFVKFGTTFVIR